jgi:hypothetical protein
MEKALRRLKIILLIALSFCLVVLAVIKVSNRVFNISPPGRKEFHQHLAMLRVGMHKEEVQALFGQIPTYACRISKSEIWYYAAPGCLTGRWTTNTPENGTVFHIPTELPDIYANIQMAFNTNNELFAYAFIGESYDIMTTNGPVKGDHFKYLPQDSFR